MNCKHCGANLLVKYDTFTVVKSCQNKSCADKIKQDYWKQVLRRAMK